MDGRTGSLSYPPIAELIPHGAAIQLLEHMTTWEEGRAECGLTVRADTLFSTDQGVSSVVALEYMAQAVAACLGYEAYCGGHGVRVGMIVGVRRMERLIETIPLGAQVRVVVARERGNEDISTFRGETYSDGELVATALMTLVHAEKPPD